VSGENAHSNGATVAGPSNSATVTERTPLIARDHLLAEVKSPRNARSYAFVAIGLAELVVRTADFVRDSPWKESTHSGATVVPGIVLAVWVSSCLCQTLICIY